MRLIHAYGKNGDILGVGSIRELRIAHRLPPEMGDRLDTLEQGYPRIPEGDGSSMRDIRVRIAEGYRLHQKFGPWGDLIAVSADGPFLYFNWIMPLAFPKPTLAADLIPFIRDAEGRLFWIGIKRGRPPGEGKHALIGGIRAIEKKELACGPTYMLETPLENLMHESGEEAGIFLSNLIFTNVDPYINIACVDVSIPELAVSSSVHIHYIKTMRTDVEVERDASTGELRVHESAGYAFVVRVDRPLLESEIEAALHPTDMSERTTPVVRAINSFADMVSIQHSFHSQHHRELFSRSMALCVDTLYRRPAIRTH